MTVECRTADDVRRLAVRQAGWRRSMFNPKPKPAFTVAPEPTPEPVPEVIPEPIPDPPYIPRYTPIARIQYIVCAKYNISMDEMMADRRTANLVRPRHVAMWLAKKLTLRSLPEIGRRFNGRDHTTVLNAVRKIDARRAVDPELVALMDELEYEILS